MAESLGLSPFELATGYLSGPAASAPRALPSIPENLSPLEALEQAILPALRRGPCFVSFSGGRDSSTVLAAATRTARRHDLAPPVAITTRFPDAPLSAEREWQERVIGHLGLDDWRRLEFGDELDYLGPVARRLMLRHGVLYPFNTHFLVPIVEEAGAGTVLTGNGGDAIFQTWRWQREMLILSRRGRARARELPRLAYFGLPLPLRRLAAGWIGLPRRPWLTRRGQALLRRAIARDADEPRRYDARLLWLAGRRFYATSTRSAELVAAEAGVRFEQPFLDPRFLAAVAREGGRAGPGTRTTAMRRFFASLLPDELLARTTKASFEQVLLRSHSREFLHGWNGHSPFPELVDPEGLRAAWGGRDVETPRMLLQATWLATVRGLI